MQELLGKIIVEHYTFFPTSKPDPPIIKTAKEILEKLNLMKRWGHHSGGTKNKRSRKYRSKKKSGKSNLKKSKKSKKSNKKRGGARKKSVFRRKRKGGASSSPRNITNNELHPSQVESDDADIQNLTLMMSNLSISG